MEFRMRLQQREGKLPRVIASLCKLILISSQIIRVNDFSFINLINSHCVCLGIYKLPVCTEKKGCVNRRLQTTSGPSLAWLFLGFFSYFDFFCFDHYFMLSQILLMRGVRKCINFHLILGKVH